jgi:hypothetical protein
MNSNPSCSNEGGGILPTQANSPQKLPQGTPGRTGNAFQKILRWSPSQIQRTRIRSPFRSPVSEYYSLVDFYPILPDQRVFQSAIESISPTTPSPAQGETHIEGLSVDGITFPPPEKDQFAGTAESNPRSEIEKALLDIPAKLQDDDFICFEHFEF